MGKNHGRADGVRPRKVGDDVGYKYRQHLINDPIRETGIVKLVNWIVALFLLYLLCHVVYALWEEL